jgi:hypothetical protein
VRRITPGNSQHFVIKIHSDNSPLGSHDLASDKALLAGTGSKVKDRFSGTQKNGRVTTPVIALEDFRGDHLKPFRVVAGWTAEKRFGFLGRSSVALLNGSFHVKSFGHRILLEAEAGSFSVPRAGC